MKITSISLSKALKLKNRLAGRLARLTATITTYNSRYEGQNDVDVAAAYEERSKLVDVLVGLKTSIYDSNRGIYSHIIEIGEKKAEIQLLSALNTRQGVEPLYEGQPVKYVASITKAEVDKRVKKLEKEIDDLQDKIDAYNAEPGRVKVDASVLELV